MRARRFGETALRVLAVMGLALAAASGATAQHRDRGFNQPGAAGNRSHVDPGLNQPGAVGNVGAVGVAAATPVGYGGSARQVRAVHDPGLNQPGAVGNVGVDPGFNQPGMVGNRR